MRTRDLVVLSFITYLNVAISNSTAVGQKSAGALLTFVSAAFGSGTEVPYTSRAERLGTDAKKGRSSTPTNLIQKKNSNAPTEVIQKKVERPSTKLSSPGVVRLVWAT